MKGFLVKKHFSRLSIVELAEVLTSPNPENYIIACRYIEEVESLLITKGDFTTFFIHQNTLLGRPTKPDFDDIEVIDYGLTLRLGSFEACGQILIEDDTFGSDALRLSGAL